MREQQIQQQQQGLIGGGSPKMPVIPAPVVMPTENSAAITAAQLQQAQASAAQSGRASTIMTMQNQNDINKTDSMGG